MRVKEDIKKEEEIKKELELLAKEIGTLDFLNATPRGSKEIKEHIKAYEELSENLMQCRYNNLLIEFSCKTTLTSTQSEAVIEIVHKYEKSLEALVKRDNIDNIPLIPVIHEVFVKKLGETDYVHIDIDVSYYTLGAKSELKFPINKDYTELAVHEVGNPKSRYFLTVGYNSIFIDEIMVPIDKKPEVHGVHLCTTNLEEARKVYDSIDLIQHISIDNENITLIDNYPTMALLEGPDGVIAEKMIKKEIKTTFRVDSY